MKTLQHLSKIGLLILFILGGCDTATTTTDNTNLTAEETAMKQQQERVVTVQQVATAEETKLDILDVSATVAVLLKDDATAKTDDGQLCGTRTRTRDLATQTTTLVVDFGTGCTGPRGITRSGKMTIVQTRKDNGFTKSITFDQFTTDSTIVHGKLGETITRIQATSVTKQITAENLSLTRGSKTNLIESMDRSYTFFAPTITETTRARGDIEITGKANGTNSEGKKYSIEITDKLVIKGSCMGEGMFVPVSGKKTMKLEGTDDSVIDYGDGTCDNKATVTSGTTTSEITIDRTHGRNTDFPSLGGLIHGGWHFGGNHPPPPPRGNHNQG